MGKYLPAMRPARYTCVSKAGGAVRRGGRETKKTAKQAQTETQIFPFL